MEKLVYSGPVPLEKIVIVENPPSELYSWSISKIEVKNIMKDSTLLISSDIEIFNEILKKQDGDIQDIEVLYDFNEYGISAETNNPDINIKIWVEQTEL